MYLSNICDLCCNFFDRNLCRVKNEEELPLMPSETSCCIWFLMRFFHLIFTMILLNTYYSHCHVADEGTEGQVKYLVADHPASSETGTVSSHSHGNCRWVLTYRLELKKSIFSGSLCHKIRYNSCVIA